MKCLTIFIILIIVPFATLKNTTSNFFPNLPLGEYKVYTKGLIKCQPTNNEHAIEFNLYMHKISRNASEVRGNVTLKIPFDDSFSVLINFAVKDSIGGWKDNFYTFRISKPCTNGKPFIVGPALQMLQNKFDYYGYCPFPPGVYVLKGLDVPSLVLKMNVPRQFFYGTYKGRYETFEKNGKQASCFHAVFDVKRPWETVD